MLLLNAVVVLSSPEKSPSGVEEDLLSVLDEIKVALQHCILINIKNNEYLDRKLQYLLVQKITIKLFSFGNFLCSMHLSNSQLFMEIFYLKLSAFSFPT